MAEVTPAPAAAAPAPAPEPVAAAAPAAPAPTPAAQPEPAPVAAAPVAEAAPAPGAETPAAEPVKAEAPATESQPSLLSKEGKPAPAEPAKAEEAPPAQPEAPAESAPAPTPTYEAFIFPEGVQGGEKELQQFSTVLGEYELAVAKDPAQLHTSTQALGQRLVDMHVNEVQRVRQEQYEVFNRTQEKWIEDFRADPEIGGNRSDTTIQRGLSVIKEYGGSTAQLQELRHVLTFTGAGNHPSVIRLLSNIGKALSEGKPVAAPKPAAQPVPQKPAQRRYAQGNR